MNLQTATFVPTGTFLYPRHQTECKTATRAAHEEDGERGTTPPQTPTPRGPEAKKLPATRGRLSCQMFHPKHTPDENRVRTAETCKDLPRIDGRQRNRPPARNSSNPSYSQYHREGIYRTFRYACGCLKGRDRPARTGMACKDGPQRLSCKDRWSR